MKRGSKPQQAAFLTDGLTIHGKWRPALHPATLGQPANCPLAAWLPLEPLAAIAATCVAARPAGPLHAMRLTSGKPSLQSP